MRPQPIGCGNTRTPNASGCTGSCFNEAAADRLRKRRSELVCVFLTDSLQ